MRKELNLRKSWDASLLMVCLIGFSVIWELEKLINFPGTGDIYQWIKVGQLILLGAVLTKIRFRGHLWYWILVVGVLWLFTAAALHSEKVLTKTEKHLMKAVLVYLLCPAVGLLIHGASLKRFLKGFTACWTLAFSVLCVAGLVCVFRGIRITDYSGKYDLGLNDKGLLMLLSSHYNTTAVDLSASMMVALFGCAISERKVTKTVYLLAAGCMFVCLSLTGGRSGELSACIGLGMAAVLLLQRPLSQRLRKVWVRALILVLVLVIVTVAMMGVQMLAQQGVNQLLNRQRADLLLSSASAEEMTVTQTDIMAVQNREFFQANFLSSRDIIWREAWNAFWGHPELWLKGTSISTAVKDIRAVSNLKSVSHFHNMYLQILIETGIPGLCIALIFVFFVIRGIWRLLRDSEQPQWERFLMLPVISIMAIEMVESCTRLGATAYTNLILMLFAGLILNVTNRSAGRKLREAADKGE